ncbi:MAG: histidine triad nucleotide-binding protein [Anaerovoracaceae bacterium]|jgi:histidine triad (HIT) family protein
MDDCIFCKIVNKEIPADIVYEDNVIIAFNDLEPQAPEHILIITKKHIPSMDDIEFEDLEALGWLISKVKDIALSQGIDNGYRLVCNCGEDGMQTVKHLHFHLLGKRKMLWPPG